VAILVLLLAAAGLFLRNPTLLSRGYVEVTVRHVQIAPDGRVEKLYDITLSHDMVLEFASPPSPKGWRSAANFGWRNSKASFFRWPRSMKDFRSFGLVLADEEKGAPPELRILQERWKLQPGTYRIREGESIVEYRIPDAHGGSGEALIRVFREPS
jgi:hypothetical protein